MPIPRPRSILATVVVATLFNLPAPAAEWLEMASNFQGEGAAGDEFGRAVAVEGDLVVVGAPNHDAAATNGGLVSIFRYDAELGVLLEIANLRPENAASADHFGTAVAIAGDVIVAGATQDRSGGQGRAYVFEQPAGGWSGLIHESAVLHASDRGSGDDFGAAVAIAGDLVAVGAPAEDEQGGQAGSVYLFEWPEGGWEGALEETAKLLPASGATQLAGTSIALQDSLVVSGAPRRSFDGGINRGSAYVYARPDTGWGGRQEPTAVLSPGDSGGGDRFGISVDLEGATLVVGAHLEEPPGSNVNWGCVYVFEEPAGGWASEVVEVAKLRVSDPSSQCRFGQTVRLDGDRVAGASLAKEAVYVFERPAGGWSGELTETVKVQASDVGGDDQFGQGVALAGPYLVVGAPLHDGLEADAGRVYLFEESVGVAVSDGGGPPRAGPLWLRAAPNPFNPRTTVAFELAERGPVRLEAFDLRGRRVAVLIDGVLAAGSHRPAWEPRDLASGVYRLRLTQGGGVGATRVTLVK